MYYEVMCPGYQFSDTDASSWKVGDLIAKHEGYETLFFLKGDSYGLVRISLEEQSLYIRKHTPDVAIFSRKVECFEVEEVEKLNVILNAGTELGYVLSQPVFLKKDKTYCVIMEKQNGVPQDTYKEG